MTRIRVVVYGTFEPSVVPLSRGSGGGDGARGGSTNHLHHHVWPHRAAGGVGAAPGAAPGRADAQRRHNRVRAAAVCTHAGARLLERRALFLERHDCGLLIAANYLTSENMH